MENWFSIDVHDEGNTHTGIFEITNTDTLLHYVSIIPEVDGEGGSFVNYFDEPEYMYLFRDNQLVGIEYIDPKNLEASNPLDSLSEEEKIMLGDSIRRKLDGFFYLDSSQTNFGGQWNYPGNSDSYSFSTDLKQIGSFVYGDYCASTPTRHDCGVSEQGGAPCFVNGYVYSDTLHLWFESCYAGSSGAAKVYTQNDSLIWDAFYIPEGSLVPQKTRLIP